MHIYIMGFIGNLKRYAGVYIYFLFFLFIIGWGIILQFLPDKHSVWNYSYNIASGLIYLFGGIVGYSYGRCSMAPAHLLRALKFLTVAQFVYAIACFMWAYYNIILHVDVPFPSLADIFYVLYIFILALAMWQLLQLADLPITRNNIRDSVVIVFLSYIVLYTTFSFLPIDVNASYLEVISNFFYPIIDIFILSLAFMVLQVGSSKVKRSMWLIIISVGLQFMGDIFFAYKEIVQSYWNGGAPDVLFVMSGFVLSFAMVTFASCPFTGKDVDYTKN